MTENVHHHWLARGVRKAVWRPLLALRRSLRALRRHPWMVRSLWAAAAVVCLFVLGAAGLWWRLNSGPIEIDVATPWLKAAIEQNFGNKHTVSVGGTQIERNEKGRASLQERDLRASSP